MKMGKNTVLKVSSVCLRNANPEDGMRPVNVLSRVRHWDTTYWQACDSKYTKQYWTPPGRH